MEAIRRLPEVLGARGAKETLAPPVGMSVEVHLHSLQNTYREVLGHV